MKAMRSPLTPPSFAATAGTATVERPTPARTAGYVVAPERVVVNPTKEEPGLGSYVARSLATAGAAEKQPTLHRSRT